MIIRNYIVQLTQPVISLVITFFYLVVSLCVIWNKYGSRSFDIESASWISKSTNSPSLYPTTLLLLPSHKSSTAIVPIADANTLSLHVGLPPRWMWPSIVALVSTPVATSIIFAISAEFPTPSAFTIIWFFLPSFLLSCILQPLSAH